MGNWNITIRGIGAHHNGNHPPDANIMAKAFTKQLRDAGHHIVAASFTYGGEDDLMPTSTPVTTTTLVNINGLDRGIIASTIDYERALSYAEELYGATVTWRSNTGQGELRPGEVIAVQPGLVINVAYIP